MSFEFDGQKYKKSSSHQKEWASKILEEFQLTGNEIILDLGCGDGAITNQLAEMVPHGEVVGIDASESMIQTAKNDRKYPNVRFELKDINEITYENHFDLIFSNAALHWVLEHKKLLNDTFQALKNGGAMRFNFAGEGNCSFFYKVIRRALEEPHFKPYFLEFSWPWYMPSPETYKVVASESEFSSFEIWGENADRYFPNEEAMIRWIDQPSIVPFLKYIPETLKPVFRNYVIENMVKETTQKNGTCFETFRRVNIRAIKD